MVVQLDASCKAAVDGGRTAAHVRGVEEHTERRIERVPTEIATGSRMRVERALALRGPYWNYVGCVALTGLG